MSRIVEESYVLYKTTTISSGPGRVPCIPFSQFGKEIERDGLLSSSCRSSFERVEKFVKVRYHDPLGLLRLSNGDEG